MSDPLVDPFHGMAKTIRHRRSDVLECLSDWVALRADLPVEDPHPTALALIERGYRTTDVAHFLIGGDPDATGPHLTRSLTNHDFGDALSTAAGAAMGSAYNAQAAEWSSIVRSVSSKGMKGLETPVVDIGELNTTNFANAGGPIQTPLIQIDSGDRVDVNSYALRYLVARELLVNDDVGAIALLNAQLGGAYAKLPPQRIAAIISADAALADGEALFTSANSTSNTGLDVTSVNEALGLLRTATSRAGNVQNVRGAHLLIPPTLEATAAILNESMGRRFNIVVNSWLTSDTDGFLLASPSESPVFVYTYPDSIGPRPTLDTTPAQDRDETGAVVHYDGLAFVARYTFGLNAVARAGICKITGS